MSFFFAGNPFGYENNSFTNLEPRLFLFDTDSLRAMMNWTSGSGVLEFGLFFREYDVQLSARIERTLNAKLLRANHVTPDLPGQYLFRTVSKPHAEFVVTIIYQRQQYIWLVVTLIRCGPLYQLTYASSGI